MSQVARGFTLSSSSSGISVPTSTSSSLPWAPSPHHPSSSNLLATSSNSSHFRVPSALTLALQRKTQTLSCPPHQFHTTNAFHAQFFDRFLKDPIEGKLDLTYVNQTHLNPKSSSSLTPLSPSLSSHHSFPSPSDSFTSSSSILPYSPSASLPFSSSSSSTASSAHSSSSLLSSSSPSSLLDFLHSRFQCLSHLRHRMKKSAETYGMILDLHRIRGGEKKGEFGRDEETMCKLLEETQQKCVNQTVTLVEWSREIVTLWKERTLYLACDEDFGTTIAGNANGIGMGTGNRTDPLDPPALSHPREWNAIDEMESLLKRMEKVEDRVKQLKCDCETRWKQTQLQLQEQQEKWRKKH